jgi:lipid-A-disaccharide synthase
LLTLLPFEPPYFERVGLAATFVGHPVIERTSSDDQGAFRIAHQVPDDQTIIAVLPGSRQNETSRLLAPFGAALAIVAHRRPLVAVVPTVANVASQVRAATAAWPVRTIVVEDERGKGQAFAASRAALAASGTVALELARAGVPNVIAYRLHPLTYLIARRLVKIRYVSLVNLLLDQPVVPELLQGECQPERLAMELERLIEEGAARVRQQRAFGEALARLRPAGGGSPSEAAAATVLEAIAIGRRRPQ